MPDMGADHLWLVSIDHFPARCPQHSLVAPGLSSLKDYSLTTDSLYDSGGCEPFGCVTLWLQNGPLLRCGIAPSALLLGWLMCQALLDRLIIQSPPLGTWGTRQGLGKEGVCDCG